MKLRVALMFAFLLGCSSELGEETSAGSGGALSATTCIRALGPADRTRKVVVSHPYGDDQTRYEVLDLTSTGELTRTGAVFQMERAGWSPIVFTPDGEIGLVAEDRGGVGVFRFDASGAPVVVHASLHGDFSARSIVMHPSGNRAYVIDPNSAEHAGGVYELAIGCDGSVTPTRRFVPGGGAQALEFMPGTDRRAVLFAKQAFSSDADRNTFLVDMRSPSLLTQGDGFGDPNAIVSSMAISDDSRYALIADDGIGHGDRVSVVSLRTMKVKQTLETRAPFAVQMSTFGGSALIVNGDSADEITTVRYDRTNADEPFAITGPLAYTMPRPQLPGAAVQITRGRLRGRVLVAELVAVRQVQFRRSGAIDDVSQTTWDKSIENIVGTVGVQP